MKMIHFLQNYKMRKKLTIIYIVCVLLPMCCTDILMLNAVKKNAVKEQDIRMQSVMQRMVYNIQADINGSVSVISDIYTDKNFNRFITREYTSNLDYFNAYFNLVQNNMLKFYYNSQRIRQIYLCVENNTIVNGGSFWKIDTFKDENWYKEYISSGKKIYVCTYFDQKNYMFIPRFSRTISIIKPLDNFSPDDTKNIIKVDLNYNQIRNEILSENVEGEVYICNSQYVLFSNLPPDTDDQPYRLRDTVNLERPCYKQQFKVASDEWSVYIIPKEVSLGSLLKQTKLMVALLIVINLLLPTVIIILIEKSFSKRIKIIEGKLYKVGNEEFEIIEGDFGKDEIGELIDSYNIMVQKIKELIKMVIKKNEEKQTLELAKKNAELKALQSQVNPHFMFNTLESIRMRSLLKDEIETAEVIEHLAAILRKSLSWTEDDISIEEELLFVKQYVAIQEYRYGDKLLFSAFIMPGCEKYFIPKLSILTFVENACVHGMDDSAKEYVISVAISKDEENFFIEISDSGCGIRADKIEQLKQALKELNIERLTRSKSTGMLNALLRMNLYSEGTLQFDIDSTINEGTDITMQIPLNKMLCREAEK